MKKEEENSVVESIDDKLKMIIKLQKTPDKKEVIQPTVENEGEFFNEETQNQNDLACGSASSSSKNTNHKKSAQNLNKSKQNSTISEKVESKRDQKSLAETTEENQRKQQVELADSIHHLSTLNINSQPINPVSTEEIAPDMIQSEVNDVNQNQPSVLYLIKPPPKLVEKLITFLSEDLVTKTCEVFIYII